MLSISAFNALLKIIEEPPAHLLFILATTELHKVPVTILSRCQRFTFRRILPEDIVDRLSYIAYRESVELEPDAAAFLARLADGGMRDAVSMLDQCASAASGAITTDEVCRILGLAGTRKSAELLLAVSAHDTAQALRIFNDQYAQGKDLAAMLDELCAVCRDLLMLHTAPKSVSMISGICTQKELQTLLPKFSSGELLRMTSVLRSAAIGFATSANRRIDAELCIIRLCEPEAVLDAESLNARLSRLENKVANGIAIAPQSAAQKPAAEETAPYDDDEAPPWDDDDIPPLPEEPPMLEAQAEPVGFWPKMVEQLRTTLRPPAMAMFVLNDNAPVKGVLKADVLQLVCRDEFTKKIIDTPTVLQTAAECAGAQLGRTVRVQVTLLGEKKDNEGFARLLQFGEQHPDLVEFQ